MGMCDLCSNEVVLTHTFRKILGVRPGRSTKSDKKLHTSLEPYYSAPLELCYPCFVKKVISYVQKTKQDGKI